MNSSLSFLLLQDLMKFLKSYLISFLSSCIFSPCSPFSCCLYGCSIFCFFVSFFMKGPFALDQSIKKKHRGNRARMTEEVCSLQTKNIKIVILEKTEGSSEFQFCLAELSRKLPQLVKSGRETGASRKYTVKLCAS